MALYETSLSPAGNPPTVRYPETLSSPPFEKWMLFEVKSARHVLRSASVSAAGPVDNTIKSIALYLPPDALNSSLYVTWQSDDYGATVGAGIERALQTNQEPGRPFTLNSGDVMNDALTLAAAFKEGLNGEVAAAGGQILTALATDLVNLPSAAMKILSETAGLDVNISQLSQDALVGLTGHTINPRTDIFFKNVDYREHTFNFKLIPRNRKEAESIDQILNTFQFYMLPSFGDDSSSNRLFIGYPYEFEISTFSEYNGSTHHITTFDRCVLTSVSITQSSNDRVSFVDDEGGNEYYPSSTELTLEFKEVRLQGRDKQKVIWRGKGPNPKAKYGATRPDDFSGKNNDPNS